MILPHIENAQVPKNKIPDYLLNFTHPGGQSKARFFEKFGFNQYNKDEFEKALLSIARYNEVLSVMITAFGRKYIIEGLLKTPDGRTPLLTTVWIIENGSEIPKLVTAYPK